MHNTPYLALLHHCDFFWVFFFFAFHFSGKKFDPPPTFRRRATPLVSVHLLLWLKVAIDFICIWNGKSETFKRTVIRNRTSDPLLYILAPLAVRPQLTGDKLLFKVLHKPGIYIKLTRVNTCINWSVTCVLQLTERHIQNGYQCDKCIARCWFYPYTGVVRDL